jgi:Icc-related predicted phosphoesterase
MTKIWVLSDLHLRQRDALDLMKPSSFPDADVCVVAGDVCGRLNLSINWLGKVIRPRMPVVAVLGNHEFYTASVDTARKNAAMLARSLDVALLDNSEKTIAGVRFVGAPLWTDFRLYENEGISREKAMTAARVSMADYGEITILDVDRHRGLKPEDTAAMHDATLSYFEGALAIPAQLPTVVVTHHAPHAGSVHPRYAGDDVTPSFASDLSSQIGRWKPDMWIHGHVHSSFDYMVGDTRVVCNPRGYREGLENPEFDFKKVVTV